MLWFYAVTEAEWLEWWNKVGIFQMTSTPLPDPQITSTWKFNFCETTDDLQPAQSTGATVKWSMPFIDITQSQLTLYIASCFM